MSLSMVFGMPITLSLRPRRRGFLADGQGAPLRAVAADAEEDADLHALQGIDHDRDILVAAGGAEDGAAHFVDLRPRLRG